MAVFEKTGTKEANTSNRPSQCDTCLYVEGTTTAPETWDTERDAKQFYARWKADTVVSVWKSIWLLVLCPPTGTACKVKEACSTTPAYLEGGANSVLDTDGVKRWQVYLTLARKIRCVATGSGEDVTPEVAMVGPHKAHSDVVVAHIGRDIIRLEHDLHRPMPKENG